MALSPDFLNASFMRATLLASLYIALLFSPEYTWPSDYLTRTNSCSVYVTAWFWGIPIGFTTVCDNACDLSKQGWLPTFDYIIVGSGAAGSVLAYRLTLARPNQKILFIEAGVDPSIETAPPQLFPYNLNSPVTYPLNAQPSSKYSNAFINGANCNCGKTIGGSTSVNAMMFVCGCDENYNNWATAANDPSWNFTNILQYMKKFQKVQDPTGTLFAGSCTNYQGTTGPLILTNPDSSSDFISPILRSAVNELNLPQKSNVNCGAPFTGFGNLPMTIYNGQRESAARAFIVPLNSKSNLYFMRASTVSSITTAKDSTGSWVATGVKVVTSLSKCPTISLTATREVIISAGSYNSPLILQRSGIGKAADLSACGITQIKDAPVGKNLMDHPVLIGFWKVPSGTSITDPVSATAYFVAQATQYLNNFSGYFSNFQAVNYGGFINTLNNSANCPDVQFIFGRYERNSPDLNILMNNKWAYKPEYATQLLNINQNSAFLQVYITLVKPKSRGTVSLGSCTDPSAAPIINGNYLDDPSDLDTLVRGMKVACQIFGTSAALNAGIQPVIFNITECNSLTYCTDAYIRCYSKYFSTSIWHPSGTCKMGTSSTDSVVDNRLRVFGVKKLRVVDASIMPVITSGNTQCPTYTIAEKAADMILADNP